MQRELSLDVILKNFLAGGVAGMCSKSAVAPLDRMKILLQAQNPQHRNHGVVKCLQHIYKHENLFAFYKGNGAQMVRIFPYAATQFTAFECYKRLTSQLMKSRINIDKFIAGSLAGVTAVLLTFPLDTIRARLAYQITGHHVYRGIYHAAETMFLSEGGIRALYRGISPTIIGMIPYAGLSFYTFDSLKYFCLKYCPKYTTKASRGENNGRLLVLNVPAKLACGAFAGAVAQSVAYPMDVTRRRMQLAMMDPSTHKYGVSMTKTIVMIYKENGIVRGLYRGMSLNYIRAIPMVSVSFCTYEVLKQALNLETGIDLQVKTG